MTIPQEPAPDGFSGALRRATEDVHRRAEKTAFMRGFLRGTATPQSYARLLAALQPVYAAIESEMRRLAPSQPVVARFYWPELERAEAIERDLVFLAGAHWRRTVRALPASEAYAKRVRAVAAEEPVRLIAHAYTRYMGDLSGGQILARITARSLGLGIGAGLDFYDFPAVNHIPRMKEIFRDRLDELGMLTEREQTAVIDEARIAFCHNIALFKQLEGNGWLSFFRNLPLPWVRATPARGYEERPA